MRAALQLLCRLGWLAVSVRAQEWSVSLHWPGLTPIPPVSAWDASTALQLTTPDVAAFLDAYDGVEGAAMQRLQQYAANPKYSIKDVMELGLSLVHLHALPGLDASYQQLIVERVARLADAVLAVRNDRLPSGPFVWTEQRAIRGWPHLLKGERSAGPCDDAEGWLSDWDEDRLRRRCALNCAFDHAHPHVDAYHNGNVLLLLAHAARLLSEDGFRFALAAAEAIHDRYFSDEPLLDAQNRIVSVPPGAGEDRRRRWVLMTCEFDCLDLPQAHNHNLFVAMAAFVLKDYLIALGDRAWEIPIGVLAFTARLEGLAHGVAHYFFQDVADVGGERMWKYRAGVETCGALGAKKDRYEDIAHARYGLDFVSFLRFRPEAGVFGVDDGFVEGLLRTFLNNMVSAAYDDGRRFACDLSGTTDVRADGSVAAVTEQQQKSCKSSRGHETRATFASQWAWLAAARTDAANQCSSVRAAGAFLPMMLQGSASFGRGVYSSSCVRDDGSACRSAGKEAETASAAIWAKYFFYHFEGPACQPAGRHPTACRNKKGDARCEKKRRRNKCGRKKTRKKCAKACGAC